MTHLKVHTSEWQSWDRAHSCWLPWCVHSGGTLRLALGLMLQIGSRPCQLTGRPLHSGGSGTRPQLPYSLRWSVREGSSEEGVSLKREKVGGDEERRAPEPREAGTDQQQAAGGDWGSWNFSTSAQR